MKSRLKSRAARARVLTGLTQRQLSELTGISINHIEHVERDGRALTPGFAARVQAEIGISGQWLLGKGDDDDKPMDVFGEPYTEESYARWKQSRMDRKQRLRQWREYLKALIDESFSDEVYDSYDQARAEMQAAEKRGEAIAGKDYWPEDHLLLIVRAIIEATPVHPKRRVFKMTVEQYSKSKSLPGKQGGSRADRVPRSPKISKPR